MMAAFIHFEKLKIVESKYDGHLRLPPHAVATIPLTNQRNGSINSKIYIKKKKEKN